MTIAMIVSAVLVLLTIFVHFEALRLTSLVLPHCGVGGRKTMFVVIVGIFAAHMLEIALYSVGYFGLQHLAAVGDLGGQHKDTFMDYLYYSTVTYTSLGLGDVFPTGHLRVISGIESLNGLILIGWSTSFTFLAMRRYWPMNSSSTSSQNSLS